MAKEPTKTNSRLQQVLTNNNSTQLIANENKPANLIAEAVTDSSINQDISSNNTDLLQDPEIKKIIDEHFAEINFGGSSQSGITVDDQLTQQNLVTDTAALDVSQEEGMTDRFIVKFKNTQSEKKFQDKLKIDDKTNQESVQTDNLENTDFSKFKYGQFSDMKIGMKDVNIKNKSFSLLKTEERISRRSDEKIQSE